MVMVKRFEVYLVNLDPVIGHEICKTRPCLVISPDEMNHHIQTVIIAPMTTQGTHYPTRIPLVFQNKNGQIVLDQIRTRDCLNQNSQNFRIFRIMATIIVVNNCQAF